MPQGKNSETNGSKHREQCWLFLGPELGKKQDAIDEIRKNFSGGQAENSFAGNSVKNSSIENSSIEENSFYAGETPLSQIVAALRNGSLFAPSRLFLVKNAELIKKKDEVELLASYMRSPQEDTALILISEETKLAKGLEDAVSKDKRRVFWELFESEKLEWVSSFFRREGYSVEPDGIEAILELVENNTDALRRECTRLMLFLGKERHISAADVEEWLSHTREESSFTLFSRIAAGDLSKSIESLHTLLAAKETPPGIFAGLAWCFRKLRDYLSLAESGRANDFELRKIGLASPKARADYAMAAKRYNSPGADSCLALTAEYDILLRSSGTAFEPVLMDLYLYKIFRIAS